MLTHEKAIDGVLRVITLVAARPEISDASLVASLEQQGFSYVHAEKLCIFVPCAFAWAVMMRLGLKSFPSDYIAMNASKQEVKLPIANEHYFTAALDIANRTLENGYNLVLTKKVFQDMVTRSAEFGAANKLLNAGKSLKDAELLPLRLLGISAELASEQWT